MNRGPVGYPPLTTRSDLTEATERASDPGGCLNVRKLRELAGPLT